MKPSLPTNRTHAILEGLGPANRAAAGVFSGEPTDRQPVHTVYGGAHLFQAGTAAKLADLARQALAAGAGDAREFAAALGIAASDPVTVGRQRWLEEAVFQRVQAKLQAEAVEDFRIDFEDGFGERPDAEEDEHCLRAAGEVAKGMQDGTLPPFIGIRVKPMSEERAARALRTVDLFVTTLVKAAGGKLPPRFLVTLPKVTVPQQAGAFCAVLGALEKALNLTPDALGLELMVESTQAILLADGRSGLPLMAQAAGTRLRGVHLGAYDYTAACDVTAPHQNLDHPACDFARQMMKAALAGRPVFLADGATNVLPLGEKPAVHRAWRLSFGHIQSALRSGFYQGWDLHPAQLPVRFGASYAFFLDGLESATARLRSFMEKAAQATLHGAVFDDAATGQGLLNFFLRGRNCGAITLDEVKATGLSLAEIQSRSFLKILRARRGTPTS